MMDAGKAYKPTDAGSIYVSQSLFDPGFISGRIIKVGNCLRAGFQIR